MMWSLPTINEEQVNQFRYLGWLITDDGSCPAEIKSRNATHSTKEDLIKKNDQRSEEEGYKDYRLENHLWIGNLDNEKVRETDRSFWNVNRRVMDPTSLLNKISELQTNLEVEDFPHLVKVTWFKPERADNGET